MNMSSTCQIYEMIDYEHLDETVQSMLKQAVNIRSAAYAPYSNFKVGASLLCQDGTIYDGCNIETAAYFGLCAERTAYARAINEGKRKFLSVVVIADSAVQSFTSPCGVCRQFMSEFGDVKIYMSNSKLTKIYVTTLDKLLPLQFKLAHANDVKSEGF